MPQQLPSYAKTSFVLLSLAIITSFLYFGQHILIPLLLSLLLSILLIPVVNFFNLRIKIPRVIAILLSVTLFVLFIVGIIFFVSWQISDVADDWNKIKHNLNLHYEHIQKWIKEHFRISYNNQEKYIEKATADSINSSGQLVGSTLNSFRGVLLNTVLIPVYTFLFLLYQDIFVKFLSELVGENNRGTLIQVLSKVRAAIQSFLSGLILEMCIVATLTTVGLMIVGVDYALLLGSITGILNLIPYVGILIAALLTIVTTLTTSTDLSLVIGVIIVNVIVQLVDNNLLVPMVVSSKVRINALVSIVGIIVGGAIAGVAGMFLAIPLIAILKVVFDQVESLRPWGILLGDHPSTKKKVRFFFKR